MNLNQILPRLYLGSCPSDPADIDRLKREYGVTAVLNLQTEDDFAHWGIDWEELEGHYRLQGMDVCRVPVRDFEPEDLRKNLAECVQTLDALLKNGHTVYVHCSAGINRSASTVVAYLHWIEGRSLEDALAHVLDCRACEPYMDAVRRAVDDAAGRKTKDR